MKTELPVVCHTCKKIKMPHLGKFKPGYRYNTRTFNCFECLSKPKVHRFNRPNNETPPEKEVRQWMQSQPWMYYHPAEAEFKLDPFIYDFAVPKIGLLIELDSRRYHTSATHRRKDAAKTKHAEANHWTLKRVKIGPHLLIDVERCILDQRNALGL